MREIKYTILPPVGDAETHRHGTVKELLFAIPYFFLRDRLNIIPPISVLNDLLKLGIVDAGMSGGYRWRPFEISQEEYDELVEELLTLPDSQFELIKVPEQINTFSEWSMWRLKFLRNRI